MKSILESYGLEEGLTGTKDWLVVVPLESIPNRYTNEWRVWIEEAAKRNAGGEYHTMILERTEAGGREDANFNDTSTMLTCRYNQLSQLVKMITEKGRGRKIRVFFMDCWSVGCEGLAYLRDLEGFDIRLEGFFHAGCWDSDDRLYRCGVSGWGNLYEKMVLACFDTIYVATNYSKKLIEASYGEQDHVKVVSMPVVDTESMFKATLGVKIVGLPEGKHIVYFPHRLTVEKGVEVWKTLKNLFRREKQYLFLDNADLESRLGRRMTKAEYYALLGRSLVVVSFARQETFGLCMAEAANYHNLLILPKTECYWELYGGSDFVWWWKPNKVALSHQEEPYQKYHQLAESFDGLKDWLGERRSSQLLPEYVERWGSPSVAFDWLFEGKGL